MTVTMPFDKTMNKILGNNWFKRKKKCVLKEAEVGGPIGIDFDLFQLGRNLFFLIDFKLNFFPLNSFVQLEKFP